MNLLTTNCTNSLCSEVPRTGQVQINFWDCSVPNWLVEHTMCPTQAPPALREDIALPASESI